MKKYISVICAFILASVTTMTLCSCGTADHVETVAETVVKTATETVETSSAAVTDKTEKSTEATLSSPESQPEETTVNWEAAYASTLDKYHEFALWYAAYLSDETKDTQNMPDKEEPWATMGSTYPMDKPLENFGYALRDIDNNGIPELILFGKFDLSISAIFTIAEGEPLLLGTYWARNACRMDASENIYTSWSNGGFDNGESIFRIAADGKSLELIKTVGIESYSDDSSVQLDEPEYYITTGTDKVIVSEDEAKQAWLTYPTNNEMSGLEFTPIIAG